MGILQNKVAIISGAGSGIGREVAYKFASEGARIVISDIDERGGNETLAFIENNFRTPAMFLRADSGSPSDNQGLVSETLGRFGSLQIAVNNAGIAGPMAPLGEYPLAGWDKVISVNLSGVFYGMRYQIPALLASGGGSIVNVSSILGQVGFLNASAYAAAKHGVVGLTKNAALEYSSKALRINAVGPGFIKTPMLSKNLNQETIDMLSSLHPIGRLGEASEVAELILWLSSDKASFVTGSYYAVDGAYLAR